MTPLSHKYGLFVLFSLVLCGDGCTDSGTPLDPGVALISGSWAWQRSEGFHTKGIVPLSPDYVILPQPGFSFIIRFAISGEYSETVKGAIELHARYELEPEGNYYRVKYSGMMPTNGGVRDRGLDDQLVIIKGDTLCLKDIGPSGSMHTYARLR